MTPQDLPAAITTTADELRAALDRALVAARTLGIGEQAQMLVALGRVRDSALRLICRRQRTIPAVVGLLTEMPCDTVANRNKMEGNRDRAKRKRAAREATKRAATEAQ